MTPDRQGRPGSRPTRPGPRPAPARSGGPPARPPGRPRATASRGAPPTERRRGVLLIALVAGAAALGAGLVAGAGHVPEERRVAERWAQAWSRADYPAMYRMLGAAARDRVSATEFAAAYRDARSTATVARLRATGATARDDVARMDVLARTRIFGAIRGTLELPLVRDGDAVHVDWSPHHVFAGLKPGETLQRDTRMPQRADLLARDRTPLAQGPDRTSPVPDVAINVVGRTGPVPAERLDEVRALGWPADATVGLSGLERALDTRLAGTPGGTLSTGTTVLARTEPVAAPPVRTTVSIPVERAAVAALGTRLGGIVAVDPRSGEVLAFAGIAFSGLQPPGSTMKIITVTGGLEQGLTSLEKSYPVETYTTLSGVDLENANGESCGGSLRLSFAHSCNSVFAPMGAQLGAQRLVEVAERFGFNRPPDIPGAAVPTIPPAGEIGDDLAVGSSAIGQGRVQATALTMASVASTIALRGRRPRLTLAFEAGARDAPTTRVTSEKVARTVEKLMLAVVREGTGRLAAIPGVKVAGKTGTAELESTKKCEPTDEDNPESCSDEADPTDTDAWFASYAPAGRPRIAVGVMLVRSGSGGDTAAPVARQVMVAALKR